MTSRAEAGSDCEQADRQTASEMEGMDATRWGTEKERRMDIGRIMKVPCEHDTVGAKLEAENGQRLSTPAQRSIPAIRPVSFLLGGYVDIQIQCCP